MATKIKHQMTHLISRVFCRVVLVLGGWLKTHAARSWRDTAQALEISPPQGMGEVDNVQLESLNRMRLESSQQQLETADTYNKKADLMLRPGWTEEIVPFLANQLSDHTRRAYESDLKQFFFFLSERMDLTDLSALRSEHIILFRKALEEGRLTRRPLSKSTVNRKLAVIKSFFNWLKANRVMEENPAQFVKGYPQTQESALQGLSDEETRRMLDKPNRSSRAGSLHAAVLHTLFYLGLRKGELIGLKIGDLDSERGVEVMKVRGKGHRVRILPLVPRVKVAIEHYLWACNRDKEDKEAPLFTPTKNPYNGVLIRPLNPNAITYIVQRYAKQVGILKKISPHSCRATCISNALDRKATQRSVQHLAGWSTPLMIQRYDKRREDLKNSAAYLVEFEEEAESVSA